MCLIEKVIEAFGTQPQEEPLQIKEENLVEKIAEEMSAMIELTTKERKVIKIKLPDGQWISISPASIKAGEGTMAHSQIMRVPPDSNPEYLQTVLIKKFKQESHLFGIVKSCFVGPEIAITEPI